jgi:hypothetical protein
MRTLSKPGRRETILLALSAAVVAGVGWWMLRGSGTAPVAPALRTVAPGQSVPRIDLARLGQPASSSEAGGRNLFAFGAARVTEQPPPPVVMPAPPPVVPQPVPGAGAPGDPAAAAGPPPLPPLNVKYIGSVENASGAKVAVLVTDRQEVLTGQAGQVVANRYRVARIGLESVDLEDVNTGQSRRVPLKGS